MPAWLSNPPAAPTAGQRWGRRLMFLGAALLTVAVAGGATMLGLDLYESNSSMDVVAANSKPQVAASADALPFVEKRTTNLPPMVLLPQDANAASKKAAAATPAVPPEVVAQLAPAAPVPEIAPKIEKAVVTPPLAAKKVEKPILPVVAAKKDVIKPVKLAPPPPKKVALAPKPTPAMVAKKAALQAKRIANPVLAKAQPRAKPVKGTMLQPPRERGRDPAFEDPPRQAADRRCRPGELARECEARNR